MFVCCGPGSDGSLGFESRLDVTDAIVLWWLCCDRAVVVMPLCCGYDVIVLALCCVQRAHATEVAAYYIIAPSAVVTGMIP